MKTISKISFLFFLFIFLPTINSFGQVTIGSGTVPVEGALLDLKDREAVDPHSVTDNTNITSTSGGLSLPRVKLVDKKTLEPFISTGDQLWTDSQTTKVKEKHAGLMVYNINESLPSETNNDLVFKLGIYVWNGSEWINAEMNPYLKFFYMPSVVFDTSIVGSGYTKDLYDLYSKQFSAPKYKSTSAPGTIPFVPDRQELNYYITDYDTDVFEIVGLTDNGILTYNVKKAATAYSLINIVFVLK